LIIICFKETFSVVPEKELDTFCDGFVAGFYACMLLIVERFSKG
jgi:hypothetical protein